MTKLTVEIPDALMSKLELTGQPVQDIVLKALENHIQTERAVSITQTRTWQLCGTLTVAQPEPEYVVGQDERGQVITNYAERVDDVLY